MTSLEQDGIVLAEGQKMASLGGGGGTQDRRKELRMMLGGGRRGWGLT